ncbi:Major facilitator superfamily transporter [Pleurostoma richardsiae]|uniref:Major facilitator superfamily transporter n=1 Tax=Pleurostoma richardsiae TaxID=41990 RepID=A0AA38VWJ0_9PEZI|nr:Major facilitator superfamily transporter [Pleurostoma richardsiae]
MLKPQGCRLLAKPRNFLLVGLVLVAVYWLLLTSSKTSGYRVVPWAKAPEQKEPPKELTEEEKKKQREVEVRASFEKDHEEVGKLPEAGAIYGNTLLSLTGKDDPNLESQSVFKPWTKPAAFSTDKPYIYNPYPEYNSDEWKNDNHAEYVPCLGPLGEEVEDISIFKGRLRQFPSPGFGSYDVFGLSDNICYERDTRLGPYSATKFDKKNEPLDWDTVSWGRLQDKCVERNQARFDMIGPDNEYIASAYPELARSGPASGNDDGGDDLKREKEKDQTARLRRRRIARAARDAENRTSSESAPKQEPRTALLLRSFTGKRYTENDKEVIRSLVSELSLRTGGEYQVFLLLHVKEKERDISTPEARQLILEKEIPREFWDMTVMWNDALVQGMYPKLDPGREASVHNAQWLSVQRFSQEHRQFDFVWNWEMDSRVIGHNYEMLHKLGEFAKQQPRKGIWERSERFYIPSLHGGYNSDFRTHIEKLYGSDMVWGAPELPFVNPVGPKPPVASPDQDEYEWGVGEEADLITLAPMFNPAPSGWVLRDQVWRYEDETHKPADLPRRATIITQNRASRRLLDIMHVEDLRGKHVGSELATPTVAFIHGLKAVHAPMPVFFDRPWNGTLLQKWFNGGPKGVSGYYGSSMDWGQEGRYQGSTWYFRAIPPQRLYNNWAGYEDTDIGGHDWETEHGRPCLPTMFLHPIKEIKPTEPGYSSKSGLPYA